MRRCTAPTRAAIWIASGERNACVELDDLVTDAFGPEEPVRVQPVVVRAETLRDALAAVAAHEGDVVFTETPRPSMWERLGLRHHASEHHRVAPAG